MKYEKEFNAYLADLAVMTMKLHNIHWNVVGKDFTRVHEFTEKEYETVFDYMDAVAEHLRKFECVPQANMSELLKVSHVKEIPARTFTCQEALELVYADLQNLRTVATELRNACDEEGWFSAVDMLEDHIDHYNKQIWFLRSMLA
ncbi:Dps family protein [Mageeibacillus indolicus]|uniref:Ferritin-like protein n=2 Tax=Mageeibacillus indolicus TaxID=884684 RepID=D3QZH1_MAGIU|nr:DNA starvation/stationary phase protection protein [Mageeibacillus indolicus]ADC91499.1 ferritin-like protein [Mageeibacillus indolicus UPII9-5]KFA57705.1 hypothetical protein HMPREF1632_01620 [Mageeibacillus indolicus 0009-5]PNH18364.1 DNA starvation/stationary phase protection protein [Mageeibacillus indolicus]